MPQDNHETPTIAPDPNVVVVKGPLTKDKQIEIAKGMLEELSQKTGIPVEQLKQSTYKNNGDKRNIP
jgi:hypothetical protein